MRRAAMGVAIVGLVALGAASTASAGTGWVIKTTADPFVGSGPVDDQLRGVSCMPDGVCIAVGGEGEGNGVAGLAERWNGGSAWTVQTTPNPSYLQGSDLFGVSCPTVTACTAVGSSGVGALVERWDGTRWSIQWNPTARSFGDHFGGVSCTSASACTAVGIGKGGGLAERWNGTTWTDQSVPNPAGAKQSGLSGVSCTSSTACTAVGSSSVSGQNQNSHTLIERWNGTTWAIQPTPNPTGATQSALTGVSCTSGTACTAVGYSNASGHSPLTVTLIERWNGTTWAIQPTPKLSGNGGLLLEVSCTSATACTAVGWTGLGFGDLAELWDGTGWTVETTPNPAQSFPGLVGVSCTSATACMAVGYWSPNDGSPSTFTLAEQHS